ncbi:MAG TPA: alpha-ketoglutarate-dependent dioxygenase AlkB [Nocardioidaceae bacterium]|nr:alpha-ketoglutarate-dependent dioxygenase AlkB [Nocardioidaceae bacterium]
MTVGFQASLFDVGPSDLGSTDGAVGAGSTPVLGELGATVQRHVLGAGAWVDVRPGWITGSDEVFAKLVKTVPWQAERRQMYERVVDVPRLLRFYGEGEPLPDPLLDAARDALNAHYHEELGEHFVTAGMCYYRDGRDSVAWHGDTIGRSRTEDTMVAIVSLGEARRLSLRPRSGGASQRHSLGFPLGHGDLIVMGGACQRTWEHAILKTARPVGPRISVQFRPRGVR